jgi:purine-binding chemotaxis protein CheW
LIIDVGHITLGLVSSAVREVVRAVYITPVPSGHPLLEGVINVRGEVVPVLDIRARLGLPSSSVSLDQYLVIADAATRRVALRVDRVHELIAVPEESLLPPDASLEADAVTAMARTHDGVMVVYDLEAFLSVEEGRRLDAALDTL